jgi:hypothetical protein
VRQKPFIYRGDNHQIIAIVPPWVDPRSDRDSSIGLPSGRTRREHKTIALVSNYCPNHHAQIVAGCSLSCALVVALQTRQRPLRAFDHPLVSRGWSPQAKETTTVIDRHALRSIGRRISFGASLRLACIAHKPWEEAQTLCFFPI